MIDSLPSYQCLVVPLEAKAGRIHALDVEASTVTLFDPLTTADPLTITVDRGWFKPRRMVPLRVVPEVGGYVVFANEQAMYCPKAEFEHGYVLKETS